MLKQVSEVLEKNGFTDYAFLDASKVVVSQRVRVKCQFGCPSYGSSCCPPNTPDIDKCREFFAEYKRAVVIRLSIDNRNYSGDKPEFPDLKSQYKEYSEKLLRVERDLLMLGYYFAFSFNHTSCEICEEGSNGSCHCSRVSCKNKLDARPSPTSFGIDMTATSENAGYKMTFSGLDADNFYKYTLVMID